MSRPTVFRTSLRTTELQNWLAFAVAMVLLAGIAACGGGSSAPSFRTPTPVLPPSVTGNPVAFFGMGVNQITTPPPNIPIASLRMWDDHTAWSIVNTAPGVYDWTDTLDHWLSQTSVYGTDFLYDLGRTPVWAQCANTDPTCGSADPSIVCFSADLQYSTSGGPGQCFPPSDLHTDGTGSNQHWIDWVTAVAQHSVQSMNSGAGHIKYYEIWNEPNIPEEWQGTTAQLVRMAQDARCIMIGTGCNSQSNYSGGTGLDPTAQILTPAYVDFTSSHDAATSLMNYLTAGGDQYDDAIAFHGYLVSNPPGAPPNPLPNPPENFATVFLANLNQAGVMTAPGQQNLPLFNTEGSWGTKHPITDPQEQVAWVARYVLIQASYNISKFYWYSWDGGPLGLWSASGGTSPAGYAYGILETQWLKAGASIQSCTAQGSIWTCAITRSGGYSAQAVWDASQICSPCGTSSYSVPSQFTQYLALENSDGSPNIAGTATPLNAATTVQIGAIPILLETGNIP